MKRQRWTTTQTIVWGLILTGVMYGPSVWAQKTRPPDENSQASVPGDDSVTTAKVVNGTLLGEDHANNSIDGTKIAITSNAEGDLMRYDGTDWVRLPRGAAGTFLHGAASGAPTYTQLAAPDVPDQLITSLMILNDSISDVDMNRWAPGQILMCPPGMNAAANVCNTFTDLIATFVSAGIGNFRWVDMDPYHSYRIQAYMGGTGATTGDVIMQCASDITFNTGLTTLGQVDNPAASVITCSTVGTCGATSWAAIPSGCDTAGGVYVRVGMINGNTSEDPVLRSATLELR